MLCIIEKMCMSMQKNGHTVEIQGTIILIQWVETVQISFHSVYMQVMDK